tara:strand:- start:185 stop:292 length:108 start_codon:yes stop_codon:yes gene_type:complete
VVAEVALVELVLMAVLDVEEMVEQGLMQLLYFQEL